MTRRIITTNDIAALMQKRVQCGDRIAGSFLHEFSQVVALALAADGYLNIDGLGVFRATTDVDGKPNVEFAPAESLATSVNAQFSIFEPVELADDVTEQTLEESPVPDVKRESGPMPEPAAETVAEPESETVSETEAKPVAETELATEPTPETEPETPQAPEKCLTVNEALGAHTIRIETTPTIKLETPADPLPVRVEQREPMPVRVEHDEPAPVINEGHSNLTLIFAATAALLLGVIVGLAVGYGMWHKPSVAESRFQEPTENVEADHADGPADDAVGADTVEVVNIDAEKVEVSTIAPEAVVTDTVRAGNFLTKMARRHYGDSKFWIYIYLENKEKIADPDNLPDGLVMTVPPAAKYGIDADDKESVKKAEQLAWTTFN